MDLKICRICLCKTATVYIFDKQDDIQFSTKLMHCVSVMISEGDGYPDNICTCCAEELNLAYKFVIKCEDSDKTLRETNLTHGFDDFVSKEESKIKLEDLKEEPNQDFPVEYNDGLDLCLLNDQKSCDKYKMKKRRKKYKKKEKLSIKIDGRKLKRKMGPIACNVCSVVKPCASALEIHMRTHTGEKPFMCHVCDARYAIKGSLKRHMLTYHTERRKQFICETCGKSFMSKNCIIIHMRLHTGEKPYTCPFCPKTFRQLTSQIRHKRTHTGDKPYPCPICFKKFVDKTQLRRHETVHSDKRNFNCHVCNKAVKSKNSLMNHMKTHSNEKRNFCNYCGLAFTTKGNLQAHIQRKHSEKSGVCDICLKQVSNLEAHMPKHNGEKSVTCKLCDKGFLNKRSLSNHMAFKHNNASKYKCSVGECRKTFPIVPMLEFHLLKYHKNGTPFTCKHCARGFYRKSDLTRHLRVNHVDVIKKF